MTKVTGLLYIVPVRDLERSVRFYCETFGLEEVFRAESIVFAGVPGTDSAIGLLRQPDAAGSGPQNIGFHMDHSLKLDDAVRDVEKAGGKLVERGEHAPGVPFARIADPDGNVLEI